MKRLLILLFIASIITSCGGNKTPQPVEEKPVAEKASPTTVSLTDAQMKTANIALGPIDEKNLKSSIKANGMLTVPNQNKALVTSVNNGVIKTLLIQPGNFVRRGQTIATIVNPDITQIQKELQMTNAQISLVEVESKRQQELVTGNAAPLKNLQRVNTELTSLRATQNALQKQLTAMGISIADVNKGDIITTMAVHAPISGTISSVSAQIGSNISPSTPIAEIVNNSQLHLDLFVYEKDLPKLRTDQIIHFTLTNNPGHEYDAKVYSIGTAFAGESKTIPVHAIVSGDKTGLIEGMNITAVISIGEAVVPAVPNEAIVTYHGQDYIFVLKDEKQSEKGIMTFRRVEVIKGVSDIGFTEITLLEKLPAGKKIIIRGAFFANAKMTNTGEED